MSEVGRLNSQEQQPEQQAPAYSPLEQLIDKIGGQSTYQRRSFYIFCILWFLTSWLLLGMNFFFDDSYTCKDPALSDQDKCTAYVCSLNSSARPQAIAQHAASIIFQFDSFLICDDNQNTVSVLQDLVFVGSLIGFFVIPFIADNFGRRLAMRIAWTVGSFSVLLTALSDSTNMLGIGLFLVGFGTNPAITLCFSFINQVCLGESRQKYGIRVQIAWAIGQSSIALIFLTGLSWRTIMFILFGLFVVGSVAIQYYLLQTPMFYLKKQPQQALKVLNKMARINKRQDITQQDMATLDCNQDQLDLFPQQKPLGFFDLFKFKSIRWTSISAAMIFFGIQAIYYSSTLNQTSVGFTKTINQIVFGISQMLGYIVGDLIINKSSRKKATTIGMGLSSLLCFMLAVMVVFENDDNISYFRWLETIVLMINRFVLCGFQSIFFVYVAELYPTQIRSIGFGWASVAGMAGSILSPFVKSIATTISINSWFPPAFIGLICWFFAFCLSETFGLPLKDKIEQRVDVLMKQKSELFAQDTDDFGLDEVTMRRAFSQQIKIKRVEDYNIQH